MTNETGPVIKAARSHRLFLWVVALELAVTLIPWGIIKLGQWIVVEDPLQPARAIVALAPQVPYRAMEAAALYHQHWAPEIWVTRVDDSEEKLIFRRLRIQLAPDEATTVEILEHLGVPAGSIRILDRPVRNTDQEIRLIAAELGPDSRDQVIIITSKYHTRRVRAIWRAMVRTKAKAIVRYAYEDPYDPARWWQNTRDTMQAIRENLGLLNVWAGFPLQPERRK
jgi:hypothetical protein